MPNDPPRCQNGDDEHDGRLHQLRDPDAKTRDDPEYANSPEHEASSEYEREIEYAGFQNLHDGLLSPGTSGLGLAEDFTVRPNSFFILFLNL